MIKRILLTVILCACFCLAVSCDGDAPAPAPTSPKDDPTEITIGFWNTVNYLRGDPIQKYIEDKFNVRFVPVDMNFDNYSDVLQQLAVQNNLPDIFSSDILGTSTYETWISSNKIRSLPKDLSAYPLLEDYLYSPYMERFQRTDGYYYAIPRLTYSTESMWALDRCILVRRDWMENLGLSTPDSWEEFVAMLSAFVHEDPDGNGLDDTRGLTASHPNTLEAVYLSIFPELSNTERGWMYEDDQWMPVYNSVKTAEALQKMQDLYRQGLLSDQFFYNSGSMEVASFLEGKTGAICMQYITLVNYFAERGMLDEANDTIQILHPWPAPDGNRYHFTTSLHWSEVYFSSNVDNLKMSKLLEILNWLLSDEGAFLWQYGLEGTDWEYQNGEPVLLDDNTDSPMIKYPSLQVFKNLVNWNQNQQYEDTEANALQYGRENVLYAQQELQWFKENTKRVNYNYDIIFLSTPAKNNLVSNSFIQQKMFETIVGQEDARTAWPKALEELHQSTTLTGAIKEVTEEAARLGITP